MSKRALGPFLFDDYNYFDRINNYNSRLLHMAEYKRVNGDYTINTLGTGSDITVKTNDDSSNINLTTLGLDSDINITAGDDLNVVAPGGTSITSNVFIEGNLVVTGTIDFRNIKNRIYVTKNGDDNNDGRSWDKAKRTIKNACQTAQSLISNPPIDVNKQLESGHVTIFVAAGDYTEDCPIAVPAGCAIIGDNLRSVTVRPAVARSNVFTLGSNCYVWGLTVRGHQLYPSALDITPEGYAGANGKHLPRNTSQVGFAFSFTPGEVIRVSPYIQNCSSISGSGVFGNPDYVPGGGGILVDPSVCAEGNRINSIVLDAFTQINQGGIGCKVVGRGYMQLVSFFVNFCQFGILCVDGGHVTLLNSNCSFGNYAFWSEGKRTLVREPDELDPDNPGVTYKEVVPYKEAREYLNANRATLQNSVVSWVDTDVTNNYTTTVTDVATGTNLLTAADTAKLYVGMPVRFSGTLFGGLNDYTTYYVESINGSNFKIRTAAGTTVTFGSNASGTMTVAFYYDSGKCKRDVGYIIDALVQDLRTDSVIYSRRAGTAYWNGVTSLVEGQVKQTVDAISQLYTLIETAFTGDAEKELSLIPINASISNIKDFIKYGPNKPFEHARTLIDKNRSFLKNDLISWINSNYPSLTYNQNKCRRDVDYLLDAVISDLITGTGRASRTAGNAYWKGTVDIPMPAPTTTIAGQVTETVAAINRLRDRVISIISDVNISQDYRNESDYPDGELAETSLRRFFGTITSIVGSPTGPDKDDLLISPLYESARRLMTLNKEFIKKETVAYVNNELSLSIKIVGSNDAANTFTCVSTKILTSDLIGKAVRFVNDPKGDPLSPDVFGGVVAGTVYYIKTVNANASTITISADADLSTTFNVNSNVSDNTMYLIFYNQDKCERDVGYIVDAIISDLATNSQESTLMAGNAYWRGASSISNDFIAQLPDTLSAIDYAKRLALQIIKSDTTPPIGDPALLEPRDIFFKSDGTSVYILGGIGPKVYQYTCSPAWTTSGLKYVGSFDLSDREITPQGMYIGNSGAKLYVIGTGSGDSTSDGRLVLEYDITSWNITTAAYLRQKDLGIAGPGFVDNPSGIAFKPDGSVMYVLGSSDAKVYSYSITPGSEWNISAATYNNSFTVAEDNLPTGMTFNGDGTRLYVTGSTNDVVIDYKLTSAYDVSSAVFMESISVSDREEEITGVQLRIDGTGNSGKKMYIIGLDSDSIVEYTLLTAFDITSAEYTSTTPVGYYSTPYQSAETQKFVATVTSIDSALNSFVCDPTYGTLYLKANQEIKFTAGLSGAVYGGVSAGNTYYIKEILSATQFTVSETVNESGVAGAIKTLSAGNPSGSMEVAPSGASAAFDVEKNFNTIINIISNGAEELEEEFGSLVEATGYTLSYAGAGIDYSKLSKGQGGVGVADPNKYTIELDGGRVFITATDEKGDFYVGKITPAPAGETPRPLFRINQQTGAIDGRAFYQSIFGFMAPFVMALTRRK